MTSVSIRPAYPQAASIGLVFAGGVVGAAAREGLRLVIPNADGIPVVVPVMNLVGAFVLGFLLEALTRKDPAPATTSRIRALIGVGFCGGLTTYSSLATDTAVLLSHSRFGAGAAYALGTLFLGALATFAGIALGARKPAARETAGTPG